jgi:predicted CXXCH cytochrome family protein
MKFCRSALHLSLPALFVALVSCVETKEVLVDLPEYDDPPPGAADFLGYTNSESKTPVCGNCHVGQFSEWKGTGHASAWADLQASGSAQATCEGCHTVSANGNGVTNEQVGYAATKDDRYHDVQCESCHGPGLPHVTNPDNDANKPYASMVVALDGSSACGECHQGAHNPFVEEWSVSRHGLSTENHAAEEASCGPCHEGRGVFAAWGVKANYIEKEEQEPIAIGCPLCHDPHDATNSKQLRFPINVANVETNLCMKCHHRRSEPDQSSSRGPHSPQGPLLVGEAVGWRPPNFTYTERISGTHGSVANSRLCAACHVSRTEVVDAASGNLVFNSTGHLFKAIACLDAQGKPTTDDTCTLGQRNFKACAVSGCHGSQDAARSALIAVRTRFDLLAGTVTTMLAQVPATEFKTGDNLITTAEGAKFNRDLALLKGSGIHNPFLVEALLTASIKQLQTDYGLQPPPDLDLADTLSPQR